jgi:hypothetical protein
MLLGGVAAAAAAAVAQVATVDREERRDRMWLQLQQARATQAREAWADQEARRLREGERLAPTMISLTAIAAAPPTTDRRPLARLTSDVAPLCDRDDPCAALRRERQRRELAEGERQRGHGRAQLTHHRSTVMPDGTRLPRGSCGAPSGALRDARVVEEALVDHVGEQARQHARQQRLAVEAAKDEARYS